VSDEIILAPYDPNWPHIYDLARDELLALLPEPPVLIEHIGSTAVPGLSAKPVIDIIILVGAMQPILDRMADLAAIGYEFRPDVSNPERIFMRRYGPDDVRTHHLHIHTDADDVRRHVMFRDALRMDRATRQAYLDLKRDLAARHASDRQAYANGKDAFVDSIVLAAGGPARRPFWNT
jgi:GrpB-like predicted nucleotidyltransferase (UPF0157 family)